MEYDVSAAIEPESVIIAPSILAADYWQGGKPLAAAAAAGADRLHVDVMDGQFVPNLALGPAIVRSVRPHIKLPLQTHLMVAEPDRFLDPFAEAGSDAFVVHREGAANLHRTVQHVKQLGKQVGVALNPATPAESLEAILPELDEVLVMTVNPGFSGQEFLHDMLRKIRRLRDMIARLQPRCRIAVDGGINTETAPLVVAAGARVLVAGSAIFRHEQGVGPSIRALREAAVRPPAENDSP